MRFFESGHSSFRNQIVNIFGGRRGEGRTCPFFSFKISRQYKLSMRHIANFTLFFSTHMWLKYKWFDGLICADAIILLRVTSQQNYVSSWLPNLLLRSFPIMSPLQFIFFSLFSTLILPCGCSCANRFSHLRIQPKVLTLSTIKPSMPLPSMDPTPYLTFHSVFKELFCGQRYVSLFPFPYWGGKCLAFSRAGL